VGLAVSVGLLAWALHDVSFTDVITHVQRANVALLAATVILATLTFPIRALRWRVLLRDPAGRPLPLAALWDATAIGFMANNLLPARAGEFARAWVASRRTPVRFTTVLGSIGVERVFDALTMLGLMAVAIAAPSFPRDAMVGGVSLVHVAIVGAIVFGAALVVAVIVVVNPAPWLRLLDAIAQRLLPQRFAVRVRSAIEGLVDGLAVLRSPSRFAGVVAWSLVLWLVNAASFAVCFRAFGLPVPIEGALLLQGIIGFGVAVPSSPGYVGVFEVATKLTLGIYAIDAGRALSYALTYHFTTFVPIILLGFWSLSRSRLHLAELRQPPPQPASEPA
jgi:uncharacterized protein (TIRG00374 family)